MGNIGPTQILIVLAVFVLLFGAKKLPEMAKGIGQGLRVFKHELRDDDEASRTEASSEVSASTDTASTAPSTDTRSTGAASTDTSAEGSNRASTGESVSSNTTK